MMNLGSEKILLLYNANIYETADVISTFVYRKGLLETSYSYSAAVGLFNSFVNFQPPDGQPPQPLRLGHEPLVGGAADGPTPLAWRGPVRRL